MSYITPRLSVVRTVRDDKLRPPIEGDDMSLYVRVSGDDSLPLGEDYPTPFPGGSPSYVRNRMREVQIRLIAAVMSSHGAIEYGKSLAGTPKEKHAAAGLNIQRAEYLRAVRALAGYTSAGATLSTDARETLIRAAGGDQQKIIQAALTR